jgi:hypothetical protein
MESCLAHHPEARPKRIGAGPDHEWLWRLVYRRVPPPK